MTFAIPLFLFAIWYLDTGRLRAFVVCAILVAATGELMGLPLAGLGLWYWLGRRRRAVLAIAAAGIIWTALCLAVIIPAFRGDVSPFYDRFASVGGSPQGVLRTVFTDPGAIVTALTSSSDLYYLLSLSAPLAGLFLLAPALAVVALPQLLVNSLSDWPTTTDARHHYSAAVIPFLIAASVLALGRVSTARRAGIAAAIAILSVSTSFIVGPWPDAPGSRAIAMHAALPEMHVRALAGAVANVPDGDPVSATNTVGSHLAERRYFYSVPVVGRAEWIVLDTWDD